MFFEELGQNLQNNYFNELFPMYVKQKPHPVGFFNPLTLVVTKGHTYLNKPRSLS